VLLSLPAQPEVLKQACKGKRANKSKINKNHGYKEANKKNRIQAKGRRKKKLCVKKKCLRSGN